MSQELQVSENQATNTHSVSARDYLEINTTDSYSIAAKISTTTSRRIHETP